MRRSWIMVAAVAVLLGGYAILASPPATGGTWRSAYDSLGDRDPDIRERAMKQLVDEGAVLIPTLSTLLSQETSPLVLHGVAKVIERLSPSESDVALLRGDLLTGSLAKRRVVLGLVSATHPGALAADLRVIAKDRTAIHDLRVAAAGALGRIGSAEHDLLSDLSQSREEPVALRAGVMPALARTGAAGRDDVLTLATSTSAPPAIVAGAWEALAAPDVPVLDDLVGLLEHSDAGVRTRAAATLQARGEKDDDTVDALTTRLTEDSDAGARLAAFRAIQASGNALRAREEILAALADEDASMRALAARIDGLEIKDASATTVEALGALLEDSRFDVRYEAAMALARIGDAGGEPTMQADGKSSDELISATAQAAAAAIKTLVSGKR